MQPSLQDKWLIALMCFLMASPFASGCGESPTGDDNTPPAVPPQGTMYVDFSFFKTNPTDHPIQPDAALIKLNFLTAFAVVTFFNAAVLIGLSIPAAATAAALSVEPTFESDAKFHWNFTYPETNPTLTLELTARVLPATVEWEMRVTSVAPALNDFLWYDGVSDLDGQSGTWQFYNLNQPTQNVETVFIEWEFVADDDHTLTFTNVHQGAQGFGDVLQYQVADEDVSMIFYQAANDDSVHVNWNMTTGEGFIIAPEYQDGQKACWDSTQNDVECPN